MDRSKAATPWAVAAKSALDLLIFFIDILWSLSARITGFVVGWLVS